MRSERISAKKRWSSSHVGDIAYYAPWENLAIYYRDFGYSSGLAKLASIDSGMEERGVMSGDFTVTIELAGERTA